MDSYLCMSTYIGNDRDVSLASASLIPLCFASVQTSYKQNNPSLNEMEKETSLDQKQSVPTSCGIETKPRAVKPQRIWLKSEGELHYLNKCFLSRLFHIYRRVVKSLQSHHIPNTPPPLLLTCCISTFVRTNGSILIYYFQLKYIIYSLFVHYSSLIFT